MKFGIVLIFVILYAGVCTQALIQAYGYSCVGTNESHYNALIRFYNLTNGQSWVYSTKLCNSPTCGPWGFNNNYCSWYGVLCDVKYNECTISILKLNNFGLDGPGTSLSALSEIDIGSIEMALNPKLTGPMKFDTFSNMKSLNNLNLSYTGLSDVFPNVPSHCALNRIDLTNAYFTSIASINNCTALLWVYVDNNKLTSIPTNINNWQRLNVFSANNNQISDMDLSLFCSIPTIQEIMLSWNVNILNDQLPDCIGDIDGLDYLTLAGNNIQYIPKRIDIKWLDLSNNSIYGDINDYQIAGLTVYLSNNYFFGSISTLLNSYNFYNTQILYLNGNNLSGNINKNTWYIFKFGLLNLMSNPLLAESDNDNLTPSSTNFVKVDNQFCPMLYPNQLQNFVIQVDPSYYNYKYCYFIN